MMILLLINNKMIRLTISGIIISPSQRQRKQRKKEEVSWPKAKEIYNE